MPRPSLYFERGNIQICWIFQYYFLCSKHTPGEPPRAERNEQRSPQRRDKHLCLWSRGGGRSYTRADEAKIPDFNTVALHFRESAVKQMSWIYFLLSFDGGTPFCFETCWLLYVAAYAKKHKTDFRGTFKTIISVGPHLWIFESVFFFNPIFLSVKNQAPCCAVCLLQKPFERKSSLNLSSVL